MEDQLQPVANATCIACHIPVLNSNQTFCTNCGFPLQGTAEEQQQFLNNREISQIDFEAHRKQIAEAGKTLFWIAGLTFLGELLSLAVNRDSTSVTFALTVGGIMAAIFIGLGLWSRKKPTAALITGLCLYLLLHILAAIGNPITIVQGLIVKIVIIAYLIKGIKSSLEADKLVQEHNFDVQ
jgi:hypothetical protein